MRNLYAIYDNVTRQFSNIMEMEQLVIAGEEKHDEILRFYDHAINVVKDPLFMCKVKDLELWKIGEYDCITGTITPEQTIITALSKFLKLSKYNKKEEKKDESI